MFRSSSELYHLFVHCHYMCMDLLLVHRISLYKSYRLFELLPFSVKQISAYFKSEAILALRVKIYLQSGSGFRTPESTHAFSPHLREIRRQCPCRVF